MRIRGWGLQIEGNEGEGIGNLQEVLGLFLPLGH